MIRRAWILACKDWYLNRHALVAYVLLAIAGALLAGAHDPTVRGLGLTLVLNVLIGTSFHIPLASILGERDKKTLAFAMSLPVSPRDYAAAKLFASLSCLAVPAAAAAVTATVVLAGTPAAVVAPHLVPALLGGWIAFFALLVGVAIVSESLGVTMGFLLGSLFVIGNGVMQVAPRMPAVIGLAGAVAAGGPALYVCLGAEAVIVLIAVAVTLMLEGRKTSFV